MPDQPRHDSVVKLDICLIAVTQSMEESGRLLLLATYRIFRGHIGRMVLGCRGLNTHDDGDLVFNCLFQGCDERLPVTAQDELRIS